MTRPEDFLTIRSVGLFSQPSLNKQEIVLMVLIGTSSSPRKFQRDCDFRKTGFQRGSCLTTNPEDRIEH